MKKYIIFFFINLLISANANFVHIPIQEAGRIKPLDTFARNQLLLFSGKDFLKSEIKGEADLAAIDWLIKLLSNPSEELHRKVFYISKWDNSPDVEIGLGLDGRESHRYSFYEIIDGFRNNQELLEGLQSKNPESYTFVEKQIIEVYKKVVLYDEIAHSFTCILPLIEIKNQDIRDALNIRNDIEKVSYSFFVNNTQLFSPMLENLLASNPDNWSEKDNELNTILHSLEQLSRYQYANALKILPSGAKDEVWLSPWEIMDPGNVNQDYSSLIIQLEKIIYQNSNDNIDVNEFENYFSLLEDTSNNNYFSKMKREVNYNSFKFFKKSLIFFIISIIILGLYWIIKNDLFRKFSLGLLSIGFFIHTLGIINRMLIMSRPPVTTLYESILFVCFVLIFISIIFELIRKDSLGLFIGYFTHDAKLY